jgi:hypothetical protein
MGVLLVGLQLVLLLVFVKAIFKFFQIASDVRSILQLMVAEAEARDD